LGRLIIVSNRVALPSRDGGAQAGGLAVAIRAALRHRPGVWFGWSGRVAPQHAVTTSELGQGGLSYVVTDLAQEDYDEYYNGFANRVLWPILHYRLDLAEYSRRDLTGYMRVNEHFASELHKLLQPDDVIWVHDYHLMPLARMLRERGHRNRIGFFLHVPFPPAEIMAALPHHERLIPCMSHYDLVGLQTDSDADNFARYLERECRSRKLDAHTYLVGDRRVRVSAFPISIETAEFNRLARRASRSPFVKNVLDSLSGHIMMIGVDRLDYTKGLGLRMDAFERFLEAHPDWSGLVTYLQITPKSRSAIAEYADMERELGAKAGRINATYGEASWTPIRYVNRTYSRSVLAGLYRASRMGLVTPLRDGMNLVAKEFVAAQDPDDPGILILSRFAGAAAELSAALLVNPYDPEAVGHAIERALIMSIEERRQRHAALYEVIAKHDINVWCEEFLSALAGTSWSTGTELPVDRAEPVAPRLAVGAGLARRGMASGTHG
jgi:trehalose 6-phosphate synthase